MDRAITSSRSRIHGRSAGEIPTNRNFKLAARYRRLTRPLFPLSPPARVIIPAGRFREKLSRPFRACCERPILRGVNRIEPAPFIPIPSFNNFPMVGESSKRASFERLSYRARAARIIDHSRSSGEWEGVGNLL